MHSQPNWAWITDDLATGGDFGLLPREAVRLAKLALDEGVRLVVDLRIEDNDTVLWEDSGVTYLNLGTDDAEGHHIPASLFDKAVEAVRGVAGRGAKALVHCHMGVNRGPSTAYAVLLDRGYGPVQAWNMIRKARPQAAIYYAMDALLADQARRPMRTIKRGKRKGEEVPRDTADEIRRLQAAIDKTYTEDFSGFISHIIAQHNERDLNEMRSLWASPRDE